jgi:hypothetical protein
MADYFKTVSKTLESPADRHFPISPDDVTDLTIVPRALRIGGAGTLVLRDATGEDVTYTCVAGEVLTFRPVRVLETGTTATDVVGWY